MQCLGVIGGSGVYGLPELQAGETHEVGTPFGPPSAPVKAGQIGKTTVLFVPRHGIGHTFSPTDVPYRANIHALRQLGATHVLSLSAVGSLREDLAPPSLIVPDQIIDRTLRPGRTFFDGGVVAHVGLADPFCPLLRQAVEDAARDEERQASQGGSYVCIEGPQFSTRAESRLFRSWGAAVVGMTAMPEARLAREAELCYATLAMVTDYDVWHESEADVSVDVVLQNLQSNSEAAGAIVRSLAASGLPERTCPCPAALDHAIMTAPEQIPATTRERIHLLLGGRHG